jgi:hypothetical protein
MPNGDMKTKSRDAKSDDRDTVTRLDLLERHALDTERRLAAIESTQSAHGGKLDRIVEALSNVTARPVFDASRLMSTIRDGIVIVFTLLVPSAAALLWMITVVTSADDEVQKTKLEYLAARQDQIMEQFEWAPKNRPRSRTE